MKQAVVIKAHQASYANPIIAIKGTLVKCIKRDPDFPGWVWCEDATGLDGWVPESYLQFDGDHAELLEDYDALELTISEGERLDIIKEIAGWYFCQNESDQYGWVPVENLKINA